MPDLIRHPEYNEIAGFRFPGQPKGRLRQNDNLKKIQTLYETIKILKSTEFLNSTFVNRHSSFFYDSSLFKRQHFFENADGTFHDVHGQRSAGTFAKSHPEIQNGIQF